MIYLIKSENIFGKFYQNIYLIEYKKRGFFFIYLFYFYNLVNQFFEIFQIDKIIYTKIFIVQTNFTKAFIRIVILIIIYSLYKDINPHLSYINNIFILIIYILYT